MLLGPHLHKSVPFFLSILPSCFPQYTSTSSSLTSSHGFLPPFTLGAEVEGAEGEAAGASTGMTLPERVEAVTCGAGVGTGAGAAEISLVLYEANRRSPWL